MHPQKTTAAIALASCVTLLSACGTGDAPPNEQPSSQAAPRLERVDSTTCYSIFSKQSIAELRNNPQTERIDSTDPTLPAIGRRMANGMKTYGKMGICGIYGPHQKEIIRMPTDWGPRTFPNKAKKQGKTVVYEDIGRKGPHRVHRILVDCDKKKTPQDGKKKLPIQVDIEQRAHLTNRTVADILNHAAHNLVHQIKCKNAPQITYEKPGSVKFTPAP